MSYSATIASQARSAEASRLAAMRQATGAEQESEPSQQPQLLPLNYSYTVEAILDREASNARFSYITIGPRDLVEQLQATHAEQQRLKKVALWDLIATLDLPKVTAKLEQVRTSYEQACKNPSI